MSAEAFPLQWPDGWPRTPAHKQERGWQFKQLSYNTGGRTLVTFAKARDQLYEELRKLGAKHVVVSTNHKPDRYGVPTQSKRSVSDDGVAIYFVLSGRAMAMACDRYDNAAANMRSLGLAIDAMRQLERHGGGTMMDRAFAGFAAIAAPAPARTWREVLGIDDVHVSRITRATIDSAYRAAARKAHPDSGGTNDAMAEVNAAKDAALKEIAS